MGMINSFIEGFAQGWNWGMSNKETIMIIIMFIIIIGLVLYIKRLKALEVEDEGMTTHSTYYTNDVKWK